MSTAEQTNDPYGGFRETWPVALLNTAGWGQTIAFTAPAVRAMPVLDQITFADAAHFEICGYDELVCCAYAVGLVDDVVATLHNLLARARSLGYDPGQGSDRAQLVRLAQIFGWPVELIDGPAGDVGARLAAEGRVGLTIVNTAYGIADSWNVLHPVGGGRVSHWEGVGATTAATEELTMSQLQGIATVLALLVRNQYLSPHTVTRVSSLEDVAGTAERMLTIGFDAAMWEVVGGTEAAKAQGGGA